MKTALADLVKEAATVYERKCTESGIVIRLDLQAHPAVTARKGEMMQVISNLIANAIYAMAAGEFFPLPRKKLRQQFPGFC